MIRCGLNRCNLTSSYAQPIPGLLVSLSPCAGRASCTHVLSRKPCQFSDWGFGTLWHPFGRPRQVFQPTWVPAHRSVQCPPTILEFSLPRCVRGFVGVLFPNIGVMGFAKRARDPTGIVSFHLLLIVLAGGGFVVDSLTPGSKLGRAQTADQGPLGRPTGLLTPLKATVHRSKHESGCRQQPRKCD